MELWLYLKDQPCNGSGILSIAQRTFAASVIAGANWTDSSFNIGTGTWTIIQETLDNDGMLMKMDLLLCL